MVLRGKPAWESRTLPGTFKKSLAVIAVRLFCFINHIPPTHINYLFCFRREVYGKFVIVDLTENEKI